jgi:signal transduction histidine kinase
MDAGELGIDESHVDYLNLVAAETDQWLPKMEERQIDFSVELPSESIWILGDQNRLTRVIHNLIKNAWQYTLPGGKVAVVIHGNGVQVQTDISDTGVGIAPADQRHLFTRFVRAIHAEHTFELSGAGLGLYTSRAIIEAHGGKLWMESQLNKGSTFSFTLPLSESNLDGKS